MVVIIVLYTYTCTTVVDWDPKKKFDHAVLTYHLYVSESTKY